MFTKSSIQDLHKINIVMHHFEDREAEKEKEEGIRRRKVAFRARNFYTERSNYH